MTEENRFGPEQMVVSLDLELSALANAARGAQILADFQLRHGFLEEETERDAPLCITSILALVTGRIGQLRRAIRGEENPANLWGPHNAVADPAITGEFDGDIVLFAWASLRLPLVMWRPSCTVPPEEPKGRKGRERKAKEPAPEEPPSTQETPPDFPTEPGAESSEAPPSSPELS